MTLFDIGTLLRFTTPVQIQNMGHSAEISSVSALFGNAEPKYGIYMLFFRSMKEADNADQALIWET
jgi:hypothetical protein